MPKEPNSKHERKDGTALPTQSWEDDQKRREYYYDDAHGYQRFEPDQDDESNEDEEITPSIKEA